VLISRDAIWLIKVYGQYTGTKLEEAWDLIGTLPKPIKEPQQEHHKDGRQEERQQQQQPREQPRVQNVNTGRRTRSQGYEPAKISLTGNERHKRELMSLKLDKPKNVPVVQDLKQVKLEPTF
jgi:hypothetical protein